MAEQYDTGSLAGDLAKAQSLTTQQNSVAPTPSVLPPQGATTPISVNPTTQVQSSQLTAAPKTGLDIQSLITQNQTNFQNFQKQQQTFQDQYVNTLKPDSNINNLTKQLNDLRNQTLNVGLNSQAGIQQAGQKVIPMQFIVGQQQNIAQQANLQLQTLAAQQAPLVDQLGLAQQARKDTLASLEALIGFGQENFQAGQQNTEFLVGLDKYQKEIEQIKKAEEQAAKEFALQEGVTQQFYTVDGQTIYNTQTGTPYSTPEEFFADGGARDFSGVQRVTSRANFESDRTFNRGNFESDRTFNQTNNPSGNPTFTGGDGMRTDRHNNPTAFTTKIAEQAGLILGKDYEVGDPFPNNPNLRTARLLGDPIAQTMKVIDAIGFYTQDGKPRWTYLNSIPEHKNWGSLGYEEKKQIIAQMYSKEGGNGSLLGGKTGNSNNIPNPYANQGTTNQGNVQAAKNTADTGGEIKAWILQNKRNPKNANVPYHELWGQMADQLRKQGLNPDNYDKQFWEILHPDGLAGYNAEDKKASSSGSFSDEDFLNELRKASGQ